MTNLHLNITHYKLTAASRQVFSRRAPTHPVKPIINVTEPKKSVLLVGI